MSDFPIRQGGRYRTRRVGRDSYEISVPMPVDSLGMSAQECPASGCVPGYFKVKGGTGILDPDYDKRFCPYCGEKGEPGDFRTSVQQSYVHDVAISEVQSGVDKLFEDAFSGLSTGRRSSKGSGVSVSLEVKHKRGPRRTPRIPFEEELRRDLTCPQCTLDHAVFGLATWCPDCGEDIFMAHVRAELDVVRSVLTDVEARRGRLGARVAARDVENALEDVVSIFEAVMRRLFQQALQRNLAEEDADRVMRKVGNAFQNLDRAEKALAEHLSLALFDAISDEAVDKNRAIFEKRHPITHNLGVADGKYLARMTSGGALGRDVRVTQREVEDAIAFAEGLLAAFHEKVSGK